MAQVNAGRVRFVSKGEYNNSTQYYLFDLVNYNGNSYYAKENTLGNLPTDTSKWQLIAEKGDTGATGQTGATGNGIASVTKTSTSGLVDTYTITYTNGTTTTYEVSNGKGIVSIEKTSTSGSVDTYTITFNDGTTTTYDVTNGEVTQEQLDEVIEENTYLNNVIDQLPRVNGTGDTITLDNTIEAKMKSRLSPSEMTQEDTPAPETPYDIHTTTGDNVIRVEGKNVFTAGTTDDYTYISYGDFQIDGQILKGKNIAEATNYAIKISKKYPNTITIRGEKEKNNSSTTLSRFLVKAFDSNNELITSGATGWTYNSYYKAFYKDGNVVDFSLNTASYVNVGFVFSDVQGGSNDVISYKNIMVTTSTNDTYEPYTLDTYPLTLGTLEYSKIGNYEDEFIYNTTDTNLELNKWYLKKNIGKVVLDGTENWNAYDTTYHRIDLLLNNSNTSTTRTICLSNYFLYDSSSQNVGTCFIYTGRLYLYPILDINTTQLFKTWLSNNNTIVDYPLANPEYILLNDTLQTQLTNIYNNMMSKKTQTNLSQVNDDLPMVITASALLDLNSLVS